MANTYTLIASNTLANSTTSSVTFSSIPSTYTDLVLRITGRSTASSTVINFYWGSGFTYSNTNLIGNGATASSDRASAAGQFQIVNGIPASTATANTFSNLEIYIPNYAGSANKVISIFNVTENNSTTAHITSTAGLKSNTAAISSLSIDTGNNYVAGSSFFLYGIKNS